MRRPALFVLFVSAVLACRRTPGHRVGQTVSPDVAPDSVEDDVAACMESVLIASQVVDRFIPERPENPRARYFELRNPLTERTTGLGIAIRPVSGAPQRIVAQFAWPGPWQGTNGMQTPSDPGTSAMVGQAMTEIATRLIRELRAECAPTLPGEPSCSRIAQGRSERCTLGT
jgi:hypothetical protein